jgi:hypothetical protein
VVSGLTSLRLKWDHRGGQARRSLEPAPVKLSPLRLPGFGFLFCGAGEGI